jgi:hypothetical protein
VCGIKAVAVAVAVASYYIFLWFGLLALQKQHWFYYISVFGEAPAQMDICSHMMPVGRASIVCTCMARDLRVARLNQTLLPVWACFGMD